MCRNHFMIRNKKSKISITVKSKTIHKTMLSYCLKCKKNTESKNPKAVKTKNKRIMPLSKCAVCESKKSKFIKQQKASGLLRSLETKIFLNKIPLLGLLLFEEYSTS